MQILLDPLLDRYAHLPPEYGGGLTSHLPMALHALHELGASAERMEDFGAVYVQRFKGQADALPHTAPTSDWRALRGQQGSYIALRGAFTAMLQEQGVDETLRRCLPDLWRGLAAAAFHGVIRTAHAVQSGHRESLIQGLAYWAWRWQPTSVAAASAPGQLLLPQAWFAALAVHARDLRPEYGLISERIAAVQATAPYVELSARLQPLPGDIQPTLQALWTLAARRYAETGNFTVLHMVTACRAAQALLPWLQDGPALRGELARAYAAALLVTGAVSPPRVDADARPAAWNEVVAAAIASDDDHVIKLVHACRDGQRLYGDGPWLAAAARAVGQG